METITGNMTHLYHYMYINNAYNQLNRYIHDVYGYSWVMVLNTYNFVGLVFYGVVSGHVPVNMTVVDLNSSQAVSQIVHIDVVPSYLKILRIIVASVGLLANVCTIIAAWHIPGKKATQIKLIMNLAMSDSFVGVPFLVVGIYYMKSSDFLECFVLVENILTDIAIFATLLNLLAMAVDQYIAILKPLRYKIIVTKFRTNVTILIIWILSIFVGCLDVIVAKIIYRTNRGLENRLHQSPAEHFCFQVYNDEFDSLHLACGLVLVECISLTVIYTRIFIEYKRFGKRQVELHTNQDELHSKKAVVTTLLIIGSFIICWLPYTCCFLALHFHWLQPRSDNVWIFYTLKSLIILNTICDPIIYGFRLRKVRDGYEKAIAKMRCKQRTTHDIVAIELN